MCHKPIRSRGKHGTNEKQAKKRLAPLPIGKCLTTAKYFLTRQIESHENSDTYWNKPGVFLPIGL